MRFCFASKVALIVFECCGVAQTIEDGIMMGRRQLCAGYMYTNDSWSEYWEGSRLRNNGNIGTLTTESHSIYSIYGVTDKWNELRTSLSSRPVPAPVSCLGNAAGRTQRSP